MQNSSLYSQIKAQVQNPQLPEQELQLKCPRCDSTNTKFCYYNNYNLSQPRHFCRSCKRYWTRGGALRNIPVGGGSRKNTKRSSKRPSSSSSNTNSDNKNDDDSKNISGSGETLFTAKGDDFGGQFGDLGSLLGSTEGHFGNSIDGIGEDSGSGLVINEGFGYSGLGQNLDPGLGLESGCSDNGGGFLNIDGDDDSGCWGGGSNGWSDFI